MTTIYRPSLPIYSLYWLLVAIATGLFFVISLHYGFISGASQRAQAFYYGTPLFAFSALWLWGDAILFLFGKKKDLIIEKSFFTLGTSSYAYNHITSVCEALDIGRITVAMQNGDSVKLSTNIYSDLAWYDSILEEIMPRITSEVLQKLKNHETVHFGKELSLNTTAVIVWGKSIALKNLNAIRSQKNRDGADILMVEVEKKTHEIAFRDIENIQSFMVASSELLQNS